MRKIALFVSCVLGLLLAADDAFAQPFEVGQVWRSSGAGGGAPLEFVIRQIDEPEVLLRTELPGDQPRIVGIEVLPISVDGYAIPGIAHLPISESALAAEELEPLGWTDRPTDVEFEKGYFEWLNAFLTGQAGVFELPLSALFAVFQADAPVGGSLE